METITGFDFFLTTLLPPQFSFLLKDPKTPKQLLVKGEREKVATSRDQGAAGPTSHTSLVQHLLI